MKASFRSKVAALGATLVVSAGLLGGSSAAAASGSSDERLAVEVQSDGTVIHFVPTCDDPWPCGGAPALATLAVDRMGPVTEIPADGGPVYLGTAGNIKYIVTSNEVIWGAMSPGTAL
jgi:hypothetical protein